MVKVFPTLKASGLILEWGKNYYSVINTGL